MNASSTPTRATSNPDGVVHLLHEAHLFPVGRIQGRDGPFISSLINRTQTDGGPRRRPMPRVPHPRHKENDAS